MASDRPHPGAAPHRRADGAAGYGGSAKPVAGADHTEHSKRAMAADHVAVTASLGFHTFAAVGHDRGARVLHRMCLDHPARVRRAAVLDIVPTRHVFPTADTASGVAVSRPCGSFGLP
ncbi:alpha/beta fold hydrolase [Streptomyces sp. NPDC013157]|uniref:alpha/beta fold hydrolase n=1 Tax=Streptomyces sp. NPDC013157 TaxID=3364861 RepID=UPI00368BD05C